MMKKFTLSLLLNFSCLIAATHSNEHPSLSEELHFVVQSPKFSSPPHVQFSSADIVNRVGIILQKRLGLTNYDRTFPILQFLDYFEKEKKKNSQLTPIEAFKTFQFTPLSETSRGGPCLTLTLDLYHSLPSELQPYIAIAKLPDKYQQPGFPKYSHTAILMKFIDPQNEEEGFILLDPSFDIDEPIIVKKNASPFFYDTKVNGIWKFYLSDDQIICEIFKDNDPSHTMIYLTEQVTNPIACSAMPMILADRRLSLLSRKENGVHLAHLNIELNKDRVIWDQDGVRFDPIPFSQIQEGWKFPPQFSNALFLNQMELMEKIKKIINNKDILDSLYFDYINLVKETKDHNITDGL